MFARKYIIKVGASMLSSIFLFISLLVMTRYVGIQYGLMMAGWSLVGLFNTISDLGFNTATVKFISEGKDQNSCISTYLYIKIALAVAIVAITTVYLVINLVADMIDQDNFLIILIFLVYYIISNFMWVMIYVFDGRLEVGKSSVVQSSEGIIRSIILIIMAVCGCSAVILSFSYVIGIIISFLMALLLFKKVNFKLVKPIYFRDYISFAQPIAISLLLVTAVSFIDKVLVEEFCGPIELGYYSATMGLIYAATAIGVALNFIFLPQFSDLFATKNYDRLKETVWTSEKYLSMILLPIIIFMMVFGDELAVLLFGAGFHSAGSLISILALSIYFNIMLGILTQLLHSTNNSRYYRNATIVFACFTMILLFVLIPDKVGGFGADGAAMAITAGYAVFFIITSYYTKQSTGLSMHKGLIKQCAAAVISFIFMYGLHVYLPPGLLTVALSLILGALLFYLLLFLLKEFKKKDLDFIISAFSPKNFRRIKDE